MDKKTKKGAIALAVILALTCAFAIFDAVNLARSSDWSVNRDFLKLFELPKKILPPLPEGVVMATSKNLI